MWQEKINNLKKRFSKTDFKVPFIDWPQILRSIESKFIIKTSSDPSDNNWLENLKNKKKILAFEQIHFDWILARLDKESNYWVVILRDDVPGFKYEAFDCRVPAIMPLTDLTRAPFFIIDKKYHWFTAFDRKRNVEEVEVFKSGEGEVPFEKVT
jgi:hypothetical protein